MSVFLIKLAPYIAILASGIIAYRKVIFSTGPALQFNDVPILFYPTYFFVKQAFASGQIPFWDPHLMLGQPLLFNLGLGLLYPPFLLFLHFSGTADLIPRHLELFIIAHLILSGITMYWGMRKIGIGRAGACLGGIAFQLYIGNGETFVWPPMAFGLPWVPLAVFYFFSCLSSNKEKSNQWNRLKNGAILILSYFMLISATHPHLLAYTYFQTFLITLFFIIHHLFQKNIKEAFRCLKKSLFYMIGPIFLAAFIIMPILHYLPETTRWIPVGGRGVGPLYRPYFATIILPMFTRRFSAPFAYTGIVTILLACGYCLLVNKKHRKRYDFYWVLLAVFWVLFSIEKSPLYPILKHVPFMQSMRFTYRGMIFYTLCIIPLAGKFLDILSYHFKRLKFQSTIFLIFPLFLLSMLIYAGKPFLELLKSYPLEIDYRLTLLLISVGLVGSALLIHSKINNVIFRNLIMILIPIWLIIEMQLVAFKYLPIPYSEAEPYSPYKATWQSYRQKYPEVYNNEARLYRIENYSEPMIVPYYFNTYSVHGYLSQATHPRRYYYLWHDHGGWFGYRYFRFWDLAYLPFYSPIYDLMGVKYFIADGGTEAFPLPREIRGQGEWVEGNLAKKEAGIESRVRKKDVGVEFRFGTEELRNWSFSPSEVTYNSSTTESGVLLLSSCFDGDEKEDEFVQMKREGIKIDLEKYPWLDLTYKVEDPEIQTIEVVLGVDFNEDGVVDEYIKRIYPRPAVTEFGKFSYNALERVKRHFPDKEHCDLIELELYPHKLWWVNCKSFERKREYKFHIKSLQFYDYTPEDSLETSKHALNSNLGESHYISKLRLYNTQADSHRRMTKGHLDLDGKLVISFSMLMEPGWYEFSFEPKLANKFRLTIDEVKFQNVFGTDGVMIGELELYNPQDEKIGINPQTLRTSSTFWHNHEQHLVDGNPEDPWQSGCRVALNKMMETDTVEEIRRGLFINKDVLPKAFMVRKIKVLYKEEKRSFRREFPGKDEKMEKLAKELHREDFNPAEVMLLEKEPKNQIKTDTEKTDDRIKITNYGLNRVDVAADIKTAGYLVLTDTYIPGWSVQVNGEQKEILRAYGYFRAVALEKGYNEVTFRYFPPMLAPGMVISSLTFLFLIAIGIQKYRKE